MQRRSTAEGEGGGKRSAPLNFFTSPPLSPPPLFFAITPNDVICLIHPICDPEETNWVKSFPQKSSLHYIVTKNRNDCQSANFVVFKLLTNITAGRRTKRINNRLIQTKTGHHYNRVEKKKCVSAGRVEREPEGAKKYPSLASMHHVPPPFKKNWSYQPI